MRLPSQGSINQFVLSIVASWCVCWWWLHIRKFLNHPPKDFFNLGRSGCQIARQGRGLFFFFFCFFLSLCYNVFENQAYAIANSEPAHLQTWVMVKVFFYLENNLLNSLLRDCNIFCYTVDGKKVPDVHRKLIYKKVLVSCNLSQTVKPS